MPTPEQIDEWARDVAAAKLSGLIPMTPAEFEIWSKAYREGVEEGNARFKAALENAGWLAQDR